MVPTAIMSAELVSQENKGETEASAIDLEAQTATNVADTSNPNADPANPRPNLYQECRVGLLGSFLMFCLPDLRRLAAENRLEGDPEQIERIVRCPFTFADMFHVITGNRQLLIDENIADEGRAQMYIEGLEALPIKKALGDEIYEKFMNTSRVVVFSDRRQHEEIVYMVTVNPIFKRIGVVFRGSVTPKDFIQDAKGFLASIPNPVTLDYPGRVDDLGIHLGFREYLYREENIFKVTHRPRAYKQFIDGIQKVIAKDQGISANELSEKEQMENLRSEFRKSEACRRNKQKEKIGAPMKCELIIEQVLDLFEDYPECRLYISGHSLGGALAVLLSLEAASIVRIPSPITCVTSGAPKVGNVEYMRAYEALERTGRLRCVQVANDQDPVTKSPPNGSINCLHALFCQSRGFRHVGLSIQLQNAGHSIRYAPTTRSYLGLLCIDCWAICHFWLYIVFVAPCVLFMFGSAGLLAIPVTLFCVYRQMKTLRNQHTQLMYMDRLYYGRDDLEQLYLDELNDVRWKQPTFRLPILHVYRSATWCGKKKQQSK